MTREPSTREGEGAKVEEDDSTNLAVPEFQAFSVQELMAKGTLLLASSGKEFVKPASLAQNPAEVRKARKEAMSRLGLDLLDSFGGTDDMDLDKELIDETGSSTTPIDEDVKMENPEATAENGVKKEEGSTSSSSPIDNIAAPIPRVKHDPSPLSRAGTSTPATIGVAASPSPAPEAGNMQGLSARELNRLKRKRKPGNTAFVAAPPPPPAGHAQKYAPAPASGTK